MKIIASALSFILRYWTEKRVKPSGQQLDILESRPEPPVLIKIDTADFYSIQRANKPFHFVDQLAEEELENYFGVYSLDSYAEILDEFAELMFDRIYRADFEARKRQKRPYPLKKR